MSASATHTFTLDGVYPWGRSLDEYVAMFSLTPADLSKRILSCADGPASFNATLTRRGGRVTSVDPLYQFSADEIRRRIDATYDVMVELTRRDAHRFVWTRAGDPDSLARTRMAAMTDFLADYPAGRDQRRYLAQSLPSLDLPSDSFDLALCSHFLFLYSAGFDALFHTAAITEMLRLAPECRIFPLLDMAGQPSAHLPAVLEALARQGHAAEVLPVNYEFQRGGNRMLRVTRTGVS